jgi:hypothetical protein
LAVVLAACAPSPTSSADAEAEALELVRGVSAEVEVTDPTLVAAGATADYGVEQGLERVNIRVVDEMAVTVTITADADVLLAEPPGLCLVGPFWNPLDAGLSDRCWGAPDLTAVAADQMGTDAEGQTRLSAAEPITVEAALARGHERCDYAPGEWTFELSLRPVVGGEPFGPVRIPDVVFEVPITDDGPLVKLPLEDTRVCSYPAAVVIRQGEPEVIEP